MNTKAVVIAVVAALALAIGVYATLSAGHSGSAIAKEDVYYTCPMHPSVQKDKPGVCPVCGMALVRKSAHQDLDKAQLEHIEAISLSPTQRVMANITTAAVERKRLLRKVPAFGSIDVAEPNNRRISMRFSGRVERLYVEYTGQIVHKGDPVADIYSPEAITAQQEFLLALESQEQLRDVDAARANELLDMAREKLLRWGFTAQQVEQLSRERTVHRVLTVYSPVNGTVTKKNVDLQKYVMTGDALFDVADLSSVWVVMEVYDKDIRFVKVGQTAQISTEAFPGETFSGAISFIDPVVNPETRTIRVRAVFANHTGKLRPGTFVKAQIVVPVVSALVVPASAIIATGARNVVWVETSPNTFVPRDVVVGASTETYTEVLRGVSEGEHVAETGGFLMDSESELRRPSGTESHGALHATPEQMAQPSKYFSSREIHAEHNEAAILVKGRYTPEIIHVKVGQPVKLRFYRDEDADCTNEVVFEGLGIRKHLPARTTTTITFTPSDTGEIAFSCGMGMVRGKLIVEE